jgi:hypothetical protein
MVSRRLLSACSCKRQLRYSRTSRFLAHCFCCVSCTFCAYSVLGAETAQKPSRECVSWLAECELQYVLPSLCQVLRQGRICLERCRTCTEFHAQQLSMHLSLTLPVWVCGTRPQQQQQLSSSSADSFFFPFFSSILHQPAQAAGEGRTLRGRCGGSRHGNGASNLARTSAR